MTKSMQAQQHVLIMACALQRYRLDFEKYPPSLTELVPSYLSQIPKDPFSDETAIYTTDGKDYLLYFKGEDKKDDKGDPTQDKDISLATSPDWLPASARASASLIQSP